MVAELGIGACSIVGALVGMASTGFGTSPLQDFATGFTQRQVGVAMRVGAINKALAGLQAIVAARDNGGVNAVHIHSQTIVEYVTLAVEIFAPSLDTIIDNTAVQLVNVFEALLK